MRVQQGGKHCSPCHHPPLSYMTCAHFSLCGLGHDCFIVIHFLLAVFQLCYVVYIATECIASCLVCCLLSMQHSAVLCTSLCYAAVAHDIDSLIIRLIKSTVCFVQVRACCQSQPFRQTSLCQMQHAEPCTTYLGT